MKRMSARYTGLLYHLFRNMNFKSLFIILFALLFIACEDDEVEVNGLSNDISIITDSNSPVSTSIIMVCHLTSNGEYKPMPLHFNALDQHLRHGDYIPDADGDGYTVIGACFGSGDDCDDNNALVNPGQKEICGNGVDDDCDGLVDDADPDCK